MMQKAKIGVLLLSFLVILNFLVSAYSFSTEVKLNTNDSAESECIRPQICSDNQGHIYTCWMDNRDISSDYYVYFRGGELLPNGNIGWNLQDMRIGGGGYCNNPRIVCDNAGNVYAAWSFEGTPDPFYHEDGINKKPRSNCHYGSIEADPRAWDDRDLRYEDCISRHGVKDMAGNLNEWTADWMNSWSYAYVEINRDLTHHADPYNLTNRATNWIDPDPQDDDPYDGQPDHYQDTDDRMAYIGDAANQYKSSDPKFRGFPAAIFRGGQYPVNYMGIFEIWLGQAVSEGDKWLGFRCCLTPVD
jgi:hypothetical protein